MDDPSDVGVLWADAFARAQTVKDEEIPEGWMTSNQFAEKTGKTVNAALGWLRAEVSAGRMEKRWITTNSKRRNIYRPISETLRKP